MNQRDFPYEAIAILSLAFASSGCGGKVSVGSLPPDGSSAGNSSMSSSGSESSASGSASNGGSFGGGGVGSSGGNNASGSSSGGGFFGSSASGGSSAGGGFFGSSASSGSSSAGGSSGGVPGNSLDGVWTGYIENYMFPSGSNVVTMTLSLSGSLEKFGGALTNTVTGTIVFGNGKTLPPATDPNVDYPPGYGLTPSGGPVAPFVPPPFGGEGFVYTIDMGTFDGLQLHARVITVELWKTWCALQTSYLVQAQPATYGCLPGSGCGGSPGGVGGGWTCAVTNPLTPATVPADCGKCFVLCDGPPQFRPCDCDANGCTLTTAQSDATFDMAVAGLKADGTMTGQFGDHNVHFTHR